MNRFTKLLTATAFAAISAISYAAEQEWFTDFETAKKVATEQKKDILINFTGSDWCGWCVKLDKEVFDTPYFNENIGKNYVLLKVDFPRKTKLPQETQAKNDKLAHTYNVRGFPTIYLTNSKGQPYARVGYKQGGPENYIKELEKLQAEKQKIEVYGQLLKEANTLTGAAKAKKLHEAVQKYPASLPLIDNIPELVIQADPTNESGLFDIYLMPAVITPAVQKTTDELAKKNAENLRFLRANFQNNNLELRKKSEQISRQYTHDVYAGVCDKLTELDAKYKFQGRNKQFHMMYQALKLYGEDNLNQTKNHTETIIKILTEALEINPTSAEAQSIKSILNNMKSGN